MKLLYKPTGNIFDLPEKDVKEILKKDRSNNYAIVGDEKGVSEQTEGKSEQTEGKSEQTDGKEDKTVYNKVVKEDKKADKKADKKEKTTKTKKADK